MKLRSLALASSLTALLISPVQTMAADEIASNQQGLSSINMFGGTSYHGEPDLAVTAALIKAGGGAKSFSFAKALVSMLGEDAVNEEVAKLARQYGEEEVSTFISGMDMAITYSLKRASEAGINLPKPAELSGIELAKKLVKAGVTPDGIFWSGYLFDKAISHQLHNQVMADINANAGFSADKTTHKILNQAMYDIAQALGMNDVKLASLH